MKVLKLEANSNGMKKVKSQLNVSLISQKKMIRESIGKKTRIKKKRHL